MRARTWMLAALLLASVCAQAATCNSGDCQTGNIAGPFTAAQVAEYSSSDQFPVCTSSGCTTVRNWANGIEGIDAQQNINTQYKFYDQDYDIDANIAVGPTVSGQNAQVLEWVNNQFVQAFDKVTGQPIFTNSGGTTAVPQSVISLWSNSTQSECRGSSGNVQIVFDRLDQEFVISRHTAYNVSGVTHYAWCVAVSSASDLSNPGTQWYAYEYLMDSVIPCLPGSNNCTTGSMYYYDPDWPRLGTWSNGFYIAFDLLDPDHNYLPMGVEACQLDRADIVQGKSSKPITCYSYMVPGAQEPSLIHSMDVADIDSAKGPANGEPQYFLSIVNPSDAQQSGNGQHRCTSATTPCTSNQLALFTWGSSGLTGPTFVTVNPYTPGCYDTSGAGREINTICVPEPSTKLGDVGAYGKSPCYWFNTPCVDSLGDRMANRLAYNNLSSSGKGPNGEYLTAAHVVMESTSDQRTGIRYYILQVSNGTATVLVNSGGSGAPPDLKDSTAKTFYYMPSAAMDENGNLGFTFTSSGKFCFKCTQHHPTINFAALPWAATSFNVNVPIMAGTKDEGNNFHWGEYAATALDSANGLTFYGVGEYFTTSQSGRSNCSTPTSNCYTWRTRIFRHRE